MGKARKIPKNLVVAAIGTTLQVTPGRLLGTTGIVLARTASFGLTVAWMPPFAVKRSFSEEG